MFLPAALDLLLPAPLPLGVERSYSSAAAGRDVGLGPGWTHSFAWSIEVARRGFVVWKGDGTQLALPAAEPGEVLEGPAGITLHCQRDVLVLAGGRLTRRFVRSSTNKHLWLLDSVSDTDGNTIQLRYVDGALSELVDCVGRVVRVARRGQRIHAFMAPQGDAGNYHAFQRYHYDDHGYLVAVTDAAGYSMRFGYETKPYAGGRR
ncbi:MAG TPA: RHS repeat protein, partial [Sorangium sp.]|nr:RHS repeat protein [Sorangium sp.]